MTLWRPIEPIGSEVVTFQPEPERDDNGDPIEGTAVPFDVEGCAVWSSGTSEDNFRAATTTEGFTVAAPVYDTDLSSRMTVTWRGRTMLIDGEPVPWNALDDVYMGTQVNTKRGP